MSVAPANFLKWCDEVSIFKKLVKRARKAMSIPIAIYFKDM